MSKLPFVIVEWHDAHGTTTEDVTPETVNHEPILMTTAGWLLKETDTGVSVANEHGEGSYRGHTFIPRPLIVGMYQVKLTRPRAAKPRVSQPSPQPVEHT